MKFKAALPDLAADCSSCAALCCVSFAFLQDQGFAYDKPANQPCRHLEKTSRCAIHADRPKRGMAPCEIYDCHGAGQYVTQTLYQGASLSGQPKAFEEMSEVFRALAPIHAQLALLLAAKKLDLPQDLSDDLDALIALHAPADGWSKSALLAAPGAALKAQHKSLLAKIKAHLAPAD